RDMATVRGWRALGFDGALVGETLVRSGAPMAAARSFVAAGAAPEDPVEAARAPLVKICGITDAAGVEAAIRAHADAIGLNLVPGTPRALELEEAVALARLAREIAPPEARPRIVAVTVDRSADELNHIARALDADAIQLNGTEPIGRIAELDRPALKVLHLPPAGAPDAPLATEVIDRARAYLRGGAAQIFLDTSRGPHPGGTGRRADPALVAAIARE